LVRAGELKFWMLMAHSPNKDFSYLDFENSNIILRLFREKCQKMGLSSSGSKSKSWDFQRNCLIGQLKNMQIEILKI
jgi:hypothetical protein